jgi:hypothetical protein
MRVMAMDRNIKGFSRGEGILIYLLHAIQLLAVIALFLMLWDLGYFLTGLVLLVIYIVAVIGFLAMYQRRICVACENRCPFNPNIRFWKSHRTTEVDA